jgi:hypothetical protein
MDCRLAMSIAISAASSAPWPLRCAIMMMCLLLLQRRRHPVQNSHRTLDIDVRRQCLYQLHHRRRSLDTFLFSCVPHLELCNLLRIPQQYLYPWLDWQVLRWTTRMDQSKRHLRSCYVTVAITGINAAVVHQDLHFWRALCRQQCSPPTTR